MNLHDPFMAGAILIIATGLRLEIGASNRFQWLPAGYRALIRAVAIIFVLGTASNWPFIAVAAVAVSLTECFTQFAVKAAPEKQYFLMMIMSLVRLTLIAVVLGHPQIVSDFGIAIKSTVSFLSDHSLLVAGISAEHMHTFLIVVFGIILAGFEANHIVAYVLKRANLMPTAKTLSRPSGDDEHQDEPVCENHETRDDNNENHHDQYTKDACDEYNGRRETIPKETTASAEAGAEVARGRIIGILERSLAFVLAIAGYLPALGVLVAAKALTRFKDLDKRDFAEYVLIGTLLSISLAVIVALMLSPA